MNWIYNTDFKGRKHFFYKTPDGVMHHITDDNFWEAQSYWEFDQTIERTLRNRGHNPETIEMVDARPNYPKPQRIPYWDPTNMQVEW